MDENERDERLADQVASLAERLACGESPDLGHLETIEAGESERLERLLPMMRFAVGSRGVPRTQLFARVRRDNSA